MPSIFVIVVEGQQIAKEHGLLREAIIWLPLFTPLIALFTFWLGWRQKENERCFSFYHDLVITPSMDELNLFFDQYREKLHEEAKKIRDQARSTHARTLTKLLTAFSTDLYELRNSMVKRIEIFDFRAVEKIEEIIEKLETDVTRYLCSRSPKEDEGLAQILIAAKRNLVRCIYKGKFAIIR